MIALACDHGAFELKERVKKHLQEQGLDCKDFGCYDTSSCDYADFAAAAAHNYTILYNIFPDFAIPFQLI